MASKMQPTIVLIPGAFHKPAVFSALVSILEDEGYPTLTSATPSLNPLDPHTTGLHGDSVFIRENLLLPLIEGEGKDVLLVLHSFAACTGSGAVQGLGRTTRARTGKYGGVVGLIFLAGLLAKQGSSIAVYAGMPDLPPATWLQCDVSFVDSTD